MNKVSVVGLGKLGACMVACFAHRGFSVVGVDIEQKNVDAINQGLPPVFEPHLAEMISESRDRIIATTSMREAIQQTDVSFVVVPTPSEDQGGYSLRFVRAAMASIGEALANKNSYHLVVLTSTVLPGATEFGVMPILEAASGKQCGMDFGLCYSPEFIALGEVMRGFLNPDFVLIGESDSIAGTSLSSVFRQLCQNNPPLERMSFVNAELAKLAVNSYVTTKITFANTLAAMSEQLPGGNVDVVTEAIGKDKRIGGQFLKGGMAYGGPCLPRDNRAFSFMAESLGSDATLAESTDKANAIFSDALFNNLKSRVDDGSVVAILGVSYKPGSDVVEESPGLCLAERLSASGVPVVVCDPLALDNARSTLGERVKYAQTVDEAIRSADVVVIANPDPAFLVIKPDHFLERDRPPILFDCWRMLSDVFATSSVVKYMSVGTDSLTEDNVARLERIWS